MLRRDSHCPVSRGFTGLEKCLSVTLIWTFLLERIPLHALYESGTTEDSPSPLCVNTSIPLSLLTTGSLLAGGRLWRAGGGGRGRGQSLHAVTHPASHHPPLKDAGVLPAHGEEVGVAVGEADVGDVAAVAVVLVARRLERRERNSSRFMSTVERGVSTGR